jgi:hypothetical protein
VNVNIEQRIKKIQAEMERNIDKMQAAPFSELSHLIKHNESLLREFRLLLIILAKGVE